MRSCRQFALYATGMTLALLATTAAPAAASVIGPKAITTWTASVSPETPSWIEIFWTTGKKLCHVQVTVAADDVDVVYPANTADHSSLSQSDTLKPARVDETSVQVTAHQPVATFVPLTATMKYDFCAAQPITKTETFDLTLPVVKTS
jgi:hypothetical protein